MMFSTPLLFLCLLAGTWCMECGDQKAHYATCMMNPGAKDGSGPKGKIDLAQIAPHGCFGTQEPIEILVSMAGMKPEKKYAFVIKRDGDISNGCSATGPIYRAKEDPGKKEKSDKQKTKKPAASDLPTGFLANYDPQRKEAFKAQSTANIHGQKSIVGRTLVVFDGSYPTTTKPIACCVIGISDGSRFAGMPKKPTPTKSIPQETFGFKAVPGQPIKSASFFETRHPFTTKAAQSLPFTSRDDPRQGLPPGSGFNFDIGSLGSIGPRSFSQNNFGFGTGDSISGPSGLSPSISNIQKPPSPPAFPGAIRNTDTGSPLFGNIGESGPKASDHFGFNLADFTGFSAEETFIPRDGEQTDAPSSGREYHDQAHEDPDQRYDDQNRNDGYADGQGRGSDSGYKDQEPDQYADNGERRYDEPAESNRGDDREENYQGDSQGVQNDSDGNEDVDKSDEPNSSDDKQYPTGSDDRDSTNDQAPSADTGSDGDADHPLAAGTNPPTGAGSIDPPPVPPTDVPPIHEDPVTPPQETYTHPDPVHNVIAKAVAANAASPVGNPKSDPVPGQATDAEPVDEPLQHATGGGYTVKQVTKVVPAPVDTSRTTKTGGSPNPAAASAPQQARAPSPQAPAPRAPVARAPAAREPSPRAPVARAPAAREPSPRAPVARAPAAREPSPRAPVARAPAARAPSPRAPASAAAVVPPLQGSAVPVSSNAYPGQIQPFGRGLPAAPINSYGPSNGGFGSPGGSFNQPAPFNGNAVPINTYSPSGGPYIPNIHNTGNIYNVPPPQSGNVRGKAPAA